MAPLFFNIIICVPELFGQPSYINKSWNISMHAYAYKTIFSSAQAMWEMCYIYHLIKKKTAIVKEFISLLKLPAFYLCFILFLFYRNNLKKMKFNPVFFLTWVL